MATRRNANGAGEASVPPAPSASARETLDASVARLSGLNTDQLRLQWRNHLGGVAPAHLPRWLLLRVLAYRIQAAAFGDLDRAILRRLHEHRDEAFEFEGRSSLCNPRTDDTRGRRAQIRSSAGPPMERPSRAGHDPRRRVRLERLPLPQPFAGRQGDHRHELERTPLLRVEGGQDRPPPFGHLLRAAPVAVIGCVVSGLVSATFYALVPAWMQDEGIQRETIAIFMLAGVLGGLAFQVPVGRISDRFDRRLVLSLLSLGFAAVASVLVNLPHYRPVVFSAAALMGGFMSTLYPVCVANAHDRMPADRVVAVSAWLILVSGLGSVAGPLIGASLMARFSIDAVFYFMVATAALLTVFAAALGFTVPPPPHHARTFNILAPQATPLAHDLLGPTDGPTSS